MKVAISITVSHPTQEPHLVALAGLLPVCRTPRRCFLSDQVVTSAESKKRIPKKRNAMSL